MCLLVLQSGGLKFKSFKSMGAIKTTKCAVNVDVNISQCPVSAMKKEVWIKPIGSMYLELQTTICKWMFMFGETTIFYIKIWNHPIETSIYKWLFGLPGVYIICMVDFPAWMLMAKVF